MNRLKTYILITIVITLCLPTACSRPKASDLFEHNVDPGRVSATLVQLDVAFQNRQNPEQLQKALAQLDAVRNPAQRNYEVEWKFAKYSYFLGKGTPDASESERIFERGRDAGKIAERVEPNRPEGYFWFGANLGELARRSPVTVGINSVDEIREAMNRVIEIEPSYQNASAYDALAQLELATRLTGDGSANKAVGLLETGLKIDKENANLRLHLAEALLAVKRDAEAREQLNYVLKMKPDPEYLPEFQECTARAKKLLETNF